MEDAQEVSLALDLKAPPDETNPEKEIEDSLDGDWERDSKLGQKRIMMSLKAGSPNMEEEETTLLHMDGSLTNCKAFTEEKRMELDMIRILQKAGVMGPAEEMMPEGWKDDIFPTSWLCGLY